MNGPNSARQAHVRSDPVLIQDSDLLKIYLTPTNAPWTIDRIEAIVLASEGTTLNSDLSQKFIGRISPTMAKKVLDAVANAGSISPSDPLVIEMPENVGLRYVFVATAIYGSSEEFVGRIAV